MEHGATEEIRKSNKTARMNERIRAAYKKRNKVSTVASTQLFTIPRTRRIQYRPEANERWLLLVASAVSNRQRQKDKLHESLSTITKYYTPKTSEITYEKSAQAELYESPTYKQADIEKYYKSTKPLENITTETKIPDEFQKKKIEHRKFKNSRITLFFKCKPD